MKRNNRREIVLFLSMMIGSWFLGNNPSLSQEVKNVALSTQKDSSAITLLEDTKGKYSPTPAPSFLNWVNKNAYAAVIDKEKERAELRKAWQEMLGVDIFLPYFGVKTAEKWVKEKAKTEFFKLKGEPDFDKHQFRYIFKIKF